MRRNRMLVATSLVAALAIGAMAAPAAAAGPGKMAVVNGIPGTRVDVCIGKNEIRSRLQYGGVFKKKMSGGKRISFRKASRGKCKGRLLAVKGIPFPAGSDKTVVVTTKAPKVLVFDNTKLGIQPAEPDAALATRHAADLSNNTVRFRYTLWENVFEGNLPVGPAASPAAVLDFGKGDQYAAGFTSSAARFQTVVTRINDVTVIRESDIFEVKPLRRYEIYFVGTNPINAKLVRVTSALISAP